PASCTEPLTKSTQIDIPGGSAAPDPDVWLRVDLIHSTKVRRLVRGWSMSCAALVFTMTLGEQDVRAQSHSCEQGRPCELGTKPPASNFLPGKVDGAAVWRSEGHVNIWITTTKKDKDTYKVAICSAAQVEEVQFEEGRQKDTKVAAPKGRLSG